jgi:CO/xanthine dehydrogenase Mo-binding subunit
MQLAETLGVPYEAVRPHVADTDSVPHSDLTGGSRVTVVTGLAVREAGLAVIEEMRRRAAKLWACDVSEVVFDAGVFASPADPARRLTFTEVAAKWGTTGGPISGKASLGAQGVGQSFATHIVDVAVDPETGKIDILRYTAVQDVGRAIHPGYVEGQIQGGVVQGIGWAVGEEYCYSDDGQLLNGSFLDYRMPTSLDLPMIDTVLVEVPNASHPYGARGVGEVPIVPPLAAVANAVADATGHRFTDLPLSPRRVVEELHRFG